MTTAARPNDNSGSHWYTRAGEPCYEVPKKSNPSEMRATTLRDAKELGLLPSVTTILDVLRKPGLENWKIEQAVLSVLTTPRALGEADDAFVERVLHTERQQDAEAQKARDLGSAVHDAMERWFSGRDVPADLRPWIEPAAREVGKFGRYVTAEKILVGEGYAGRTDLILETDAEWLIFDFKSAKRLPDKPWPENQLQLAAYAAAFHRMTSRESVVFDAEQPKRIRVANCFISTTEQGKFVIHEHSEWQRSFNQGFRPLVEVWQWVNNFWPSLDGLWPSLNGR